MRFARLLIAVFLPLLSFSNPLCGAPLGAWYAYVTNQTSDNVTPILLAPNTGTPLTSIPLTGTVTTAPVAITISPDGNIAYVVENGGAGIIGNLAVINTLTNTLITTIPIGSDPISIAVSADGLIGYVPNLDTSQVTPIDLSVPTAPVAGTPITIPGSVPIDVAVAPNGLTIYVVDAAGQVFPVDVTTNPATVGTPIPLGVGTLPLSIAITPNGTRAYVVNSGTSTVSVIDLTNQTVLTTIPITSFASFIAINSTGTRAYVTSTAGTNQSFLTAIDIATNTIVGGAAIPGTTVISGIALTPDGRTAYLTNFGTENDGTTVIPVDISTDNLLPAPAISLVPVGGIAPSSIAITPDQAPIAFFTTTIATLGSPTLFDASASFSPVGTIVSYAWDFGDGTTLVTSDPAVSHTYTAPGEYLVILVVTNSAGTSTFQTFTGHVVSNNGGISAIFARVVFILAPPTPTPTILPIFPPTELKGFQRSNKFATQTEFVNIITWKAPCTGATPVAYRIYRNPELTKLAAIINPDKRLRFKDHNRKEGRTYTYFIVSLDELGNQSVAACVTVPPK